MEGGFITALRQNHALEHATISLLTRKVGTPLRLIGQAAPSGFYIFGNIPSEAIREAATEALTRLKRGERELALSPLCGTNTSVAGIMAGIACFLALRGEGRSRRLPLAILAATCAIMAAPAVGKMVQKHLTTSADVSDVFIKRITRRGTQTRILYKIETARESRAE